MPPGNFVSNLGLATQDKPLSFTLFNGQPGVSYMFKISEDARIGAGITLGPNPGVHVGFLMRF
jgi:hypothetical protein